jgi:formate hydrogenlyase subunit 3/multisubunit Na+/H+ antiporter MnhD subunit
VLSIPFLILLVVAAICFGLNARIATRLLGSIAAGASLLAGLVLAGLAFSQNLPLDQQLFQWSVTDAFVLDVVLQLEAFNLAFSLIILLGGALALLVVALALTGGLRSFGNLFGTALLAEAALVFALLCSSVLLWPTLWAIIALASFATIWSSGALRKGVDGSFILASTIPASLLLQFALVLSGNNGTIQGAGAALALVVAVALAAGLAPFRSSITNLLEGPAALLGLLLGLGLPLVALLSLWRLVALSPQLQTSQLWQAGLATYGLTVLVVAAAGALRERKFKDLLGWIWSASAGVGLVAIAIAHQEALLVIANGALGLLGLSLIVAVLESYGRDGDYSAINFEELPLDRKLGRWLALGWALAAGSLIGLPPLWGFWAYSALIGSALAHLPWVAPVLLFGLSLLGFALLLPLSGLLSRAFLAHKQAESLPGNRFQLVNGLPALVLALLGLLPMLAGLLAVDPPLWALIAVWLVAALAAWGIASLWRQPSQAESFSQTPAILAADALGESLSHIAWFADPKLLIERLWQLLSILGRGVQALMTLFERRYYLAGVLLALISILLIMAQ